MCCESGELLTVSTPLCILRWLHSSIKCKVQAVTDVIKFAYHKRMGQDCRARCMMTSMFKFSENSGVNDDIACPKCTVLPCFAATLRSDVRACQEEVRYLPLDAADFYCLTHTCALSNMLLMCLKCISLHHPPRSLQTWCSEPYCNAEIAVWSNMS